MEQRLQIEYHHYINPAVDNLSSLLAPMEAKGFGYQLQTDVRGKS